MSDGSQSTPGEAAEHKRTAPLPDLLRSREIGRFVVLSKLGEGGMGVVVAAYDPELDRKVAIKLLHARSRESDAERRRLLAEAQALARLNDPNVVAVYDAGTHEGHVFVAMEFIEGQTLRKWLTAEPRRWAQVLDVMLPAGRGLSAAHARGLAHRDFKPGNVMLGDDGRVRVMDFGLALAQEGSSSIDEPEDERVKPRERALGQALTQAGKLIGTPAYMAPEQLSGERGGPAADQFSFCVSLWEGLYGQRPFSGQTLQELFARVLVGKLDEPPKAARVPRWLRRVVEKGLAVDPHHRWSSMIELLAALEKGRTRGRWTGLIALSLAVTTGVVLVLATDERARCSGARGKLEGIWDGTTRVAVAEAFGGTHVPYAEDAHRSVEQTLDAYTDHWLELRTETCEATRVRGDQSEALMDLRISCLDGKLRDVAALTEVLAHADAEVVKNAAQAASALPNPEECASLDRDAAELLQPTDTAVVEEVEAAREHVAQARALSLSGKYADGVAVAKLAIEAARQTGYKPVIAEAAQILTSASRTWPPARPARLMRRHFTLPPPRAMTASRLRL
jgi:tRNA A-37 threonylcarbamoyl transferase component Bud32